MKVSVRILRFDSEKDKKPYWQQFEVEAEPTDRVLDLLHYIRDEHDGTLAFRRSCGHGICGSDAMVINGKNRLACKTLVKDLKQPITIEPLKGFRVIKDLIVDMEPFFAKYRAIMPYLINDEPPPPTERLQSPEERELFDDTTKCILCACCTLAARPVALSFGQTANISDLQPSLLPIGSSLTAATGLHISGYRFWLSMEACSLAGQLSTALTLALVASMSRRQFWNSGKPS